MKARGAAIQAGLAAAGLLAALVTWQRPAEESLATDVVVLDIGKSDLEKIRYQDSTHWSELVPHRDDAEAPVWLHYGTFPPDAGSADGGTGTDAGFRVLQVQKPAPDRDVVANEQAEKLVEHFSPLKAVRSLGVLSPDKLKELGLAGSPRKLQVVARGAPHDFLLSSTGASAPYLLDSKDQRVYVVPMATLTELESAASKLIDRRLHLFKMTEPDAVMVSAADKHRAIPVGLDSAGKVERAGPADKPDAPVKNWLDQLQRLTPFDFLGKGEEPKTGPVVVAVRVGYSTRDRALGFIELGKSGADTYARTEHTAGWVKARVGPDVLKDVAKVVGP